MRRTSIAAGSEFADPTCVRNMRWWHPKSRCDAPNHVAVFYIFFSQSKADVRDALHALKRLMLRLMGPCSPMAPSGSLEGYGKTPCLVIGTGDLHAREAPQQHAAERVEGIE